MTTRSKIFNIEFPDGTRIIREEIKNNFVSGISETKLFNGTPLSYREMYDNGNMLEKDFHDGKIMKIFAVYDGKPQNLETFKYNECGELILNIHYSFSDDGNVIKRDIFTNMSLSELGIVYNDNTDEVLPLDIDD